MASVNDRLADLLIRREIVLERLRAGESRVTESAVRALLFELETLVRSREITTPRQNAARLLRLRNLLEDAERMIREHYTRISIDHNAVRRSLAGIEMRATIDAINNAARFPLATARLSPRTVTALLRDAVVEGAPASEWWAGEGRRLAFDFRNQMRAGFLGGENVDQLVRRMRDTPIGDLPVKRIRPLVRTSFTSVSNSARTATMEANSATIKGVQQRSTLDGRTSDICKAYSGLVWSLPDYKPVDHDLPFDGGPPRHINCRSSLVPVLKSWEELAGKRLPGGQGHPSQGVDSRFRENLRKQGFTEDQIAKAKRRVQSSMDGEVPDDLSYESWLRTKSETFQREALGGRKFDLWKKDRITLRDLVNEDGRPLTVAQLSQ